MKEYLKKYHSRIVLMGLFVFLFHGAKLHSTVIGIDTEDIIHIQGDFYGGWLNTGRQGLYALKWLMDSLNFQPFMAGLLTLVLFAVAVCAFFLLWDWAFARGENGNRWAWITGSLLLISHPIMTEQFYFTLQSVEICIGLLLTVAALYLIFSYRNGGKLWRLFVSGLCLLVTFSTYQAFVVIFIFGTVCILLLESIAGLQNDGKTSAKVLLGGMVPYIGVFLSAFAVNMLITRLFFGSSDYLGGQILWGKFDVMDNFRAIVGHVVKVFTGYETLHYHFSFGLLCMMTIVLVMILCVRKRRENGKKGVWIVTFLYLAALLSTPFLMTLICGGAPVIRSQLVLPLMTGFLAYLDVMLLAQNKSIVGIGRKMAVACVAASCILGIWAQTGTTMSLYYTDAMRYEQDVFLGREMITEIDRVSEGEELPVAVVGRKPFVGNHACVTGEIIGKSFFDHDVEVEPKYYWSTRRILGFLHVLGADFSQADMGEFENVVNYSRNMPVWPAKDSVQQYNGMIVVKLSEEDEAE